jgi:hypothetical protein
MASSEIRFSLSVLLDNWSGENRNPLCFEGENVRTTILKTENYKRYCLRQKIICLRSFLYAESRLQDIGCCIAQSQAIGKKL